MILCFKLDNIIHILICFYNLMLLLFWMCLQHSYILAKELSSEVNQSKHTFFQTELRRNMSCFSAVGTSWCSRGSLREPRDLQIKMLWLPLFSFVALIPEGGLLSRNGKRRHLALLTVLVEMHGVLHLTRCWLWACCKSFTMLRYCCLYLYSLQEMILSSIYVVDYVY